MSLNEYAEILKQECRDLNLIRDKQTGKFSDPDAGHYVKKTGRYSILTGTGYIDTGFVDHLWGLPVCWDAVGANKNDNTIFKETVIDGLNRNSPFFT